MSIYEFKVTYQGNTKTSTVKIVDNQLLISESTKSILNCKFQDILMSKQKESIVITSKNASFQEFEIKGNKNDLEDFYTKVSNLLIQNRSEIKRVSVITKIDENQSVVSSSYDKSKLLKNSSSDIEVDYQKLLKKSVLSNKDKLTSKLNSFSQSNDIKIMDDENYKKFNSIINGNFYSANSNNFLNTKTSNSILFQQITNKTTSYNQNKCKLKKILDLEMNMSTLLKGLCFTIFLILLISNLIEIKRLINTNNSILVNATSIVDNDDEFYSDKNNEIDTIDYDMNLVNKNDKLTDLKVNEINSQLESSTNENENVENLDISISKSNDPTTPNIGAESNNESIKIEEVKILSDEDLKIDNLENMILMTTKEDEIQNIDETLDVNRKNDNVNDTKYLIELFGLNFDYRTICMVITFLNLIFLSKINGILNNTLDFTSIIFKTKYLNENKISHVEENKTFFIKTSLIVDINLYTLFELLITNNKVESKNNSTQNKFYMKLNEVTTNKALQLVLCNRENEDSDIFVIESNSNDLYNRSKVTFIHKINFNEKTSKDDLDYKENTLERFYRYSLIESSLKLFKL